MLQRPIMYFVLLFICSAGLLLFFLLDHRSSSINRGEKPELEGPFSAHSQSAIANKVQHDVLEKLLQDREYYRQLTTDERFPLSLDVNDVNTLVEVRVKQISAEGKITTIKGSLVSTEGSMIMTIGEKFTHVFLTANNAVYEFSGQDFEGTVARTEDMRLANDIAIPSSQSVELYSPKLQQLNTLEGAVQ